MNGDDRLFWELVVMCGNDQDHEVFLDVEVPGIPKPQPRSKARGFRTKDGRVMAQVYNPKTSSDWKRNILHFVSEACSGGDLVSGAVVLMCAVYLPRPQALMGAKSPDGAIAHTKRGDKDNFEKAIMDALKGVVWVDDAIVCGGGTWKFYCEKTGVPRARIVALKKRGG